MKKIIVLLFFSLLLVSTVSAFEFLPVHSYDEQSKTTTITNFLGLGSDLAEATLKTEHEVRVGAGYLNVGNLTATGKTDINDIISGFTFEDLKTGKSLNRQIDVKVFTDGQIEVPDLAESCDTLQNGTSFCNKLVVGSHLENGKVWKDFDGKIKDGETLYLGLFTDVQVGDRVDWVATIAGVKIKEWAVWTSDLNTNLISYFKLNETSGNFANDSINNVNYLTNVTNLTKGVTGRIGTAWTANATTSGLLNQSSGNSTNLPTTNSSITINQWITTAAAGSNQHIVGWQQAGGTNYLQSWIDGGKYLFRSNVLNTSDFLSAEPVTNTTFQMVTWRFNAATSNVSLWVNGSYRQSVLRTWTGTTGKVLSMFEDPARNFGFNGTLDEVGIWTTALSDAQILQLYNAGAGITYQQFLTLTLLNPANASNNFTVNTGNFNGNASDPSGTGIKNISFLLDGVINQTNTSSLQGFYNFSVTGLTEGSHNWTLQGYDNASSLINATNGTFTFSVNTAPTINVTSPTNQSYSTSTIFFNSTNSTPVSKWIVNYNGSNVTLSSINTSLTVEDGAFNLKLYANNSVTGVFGLNQTINFSVDAHSPQVNITFPLNTTYVTNYTTVNQVNISLNYTASDTFLSKCWYQFDQNGTNVSVTCGTNASLTFPYGQHNFTVYANDTSGNLNSSFIVATWNYTVFDYNSYTYSTSIPELTPATIAGNFQVNATLSSAVLQYNNTNYSASIASLGTNNYTFTGSFTTPEVNVDTNVTWFFWVNGINTTRFNQTVNNIALDNCSSNNFTLINYTLVDELTQVIINNSNASIESSTTLMSNSGHVVATYNTTYTGNSTTIAKVCSATNITSSGLKLWEQSRYSSTNYVFEAHNLQNASIASLPTNISLYDLPSASATTFTIVYKSSTFLPIKDAVVNIQRKYIGEGVYKLIEAPLTDSNGQASASLDLNAVIYRIIMTRNGTTLATFENPTIECANILTGECPIELNERQSINLTQNIDIVNDFNYGYNQNNRTLSLVFTIPSGTARTVNLIVNQTTILGNTTACNQTSFASSGQIDCVVSNTIGDVFAHSFIYLDGQFYGQGSTTILDDRSQYFGSDNVILTFFLVLSLALLMISDPIAILFGVVIGLIASSLMLLLNTGGLFGATSVLMYVIIIVIVMIIKISNRQRSI